MAKTKTKSTLITLEPEQRDSHFFNNHATQVMRRSLPYILNPRGILIHRVRRRRKHLRNGEVSHISTNYWCGNGVSNTGETLAEPPRNRLLCARCEALAVAAGKPSSRELTGRHVHIGKLRAFRVCCPNNN